MADQKATIQELKRRGFTVTTTADKGLLVEKELFWGKFGYDTGIGMMLVTSSGEEPFC